jgi:hypothetical protein
MFKNPPEPEQTEEGLVRDIYWPEIDYLERVAPDAPTAVVDVFLKLGKSNNAWVRRAAFNIGAAIPAGEAARLKPLLKAWLATGFGWRTDPRQMVDFAVNLLKGGEYETGRWVADVLFRPVPKTSERAGILLDDFWYERGLPRVVEALSDNGLEIVLPWLVTYERQRKHLTASIDVTYVSRESIRIQSNPATAKSIEQSLIVAVRDLATSEMLRDPQTAIAALVDTRMILARKIALYAVGEALDRDGLSTEQVDRLLAAATSLMSDAASRHGACQIEYGELARSVARIAPEALEPILDSLEGGPQVDLGELRERLRRDDDETDDEIDERVQETLDRIQHRWLSAIGADAMPAALAEVLANLDARFGVIENPLAPSLRITSWTGPNSPVSQDDMAAMSPAELVTHLESWHDYGDGWGPEPSHEGQGRMLTELVTTNPESLAGVGGLVDRLRPTYLRAIVQGWEGALKSGIAPNWRQVAEVVSQILAHDGESRFAPEGGRWDDDEDFRPAKQAAIRLLAELVRRRDEAFVPSEDLAKFAGMLIYEASDEAAWLEYSDDVSDSGMDPLTTSLNWQWPIRVRGLFNLVSHGNDAPWYGAAQSALEFELARNDDRGASRAVLGQALGWLLDTDPEWLGPQVPRLLGTAAGVTRSQEICVTTALATHYYHPKLYDVLSAPMVAVINLQDPPVAGWIGQSQPLQVIGEWVIWALVRGHITMSDPVAKAFFGSVDPNLRGGAIGSVAWSFMHAESVDDQLRDRLAGLWDARVEHVRTNPADRLELREFTWFVKSGKFDVAWWLPRFAEAVRLCPEVAGERYMVEDELASAADSDPRGAFEVAKVLVGSRGEGGMPPWELTQLAVPTVIARAIASPDDALKREAIEFMNLLGEDGHTRLAKQVQEVLEGSARPDQTGC